MGGGGRRGGEGEDLLVATGAASEDDDCGVGTIAVLDGETTAYSASFSSDSI